MARSQVASFCRTAVLVRRFGFQGWELAYSSMLGDGQVWSSLFGQVAIQRGPRAAANVDSCFQQWGNTPVDKTTGPVRLCCNPVMV